MIILGAGVGGLLLAAELSRSLHVAVLERRNRRRVKSHCITAGRRTEGSDFSGAIDRTYSSIDFYLGTTEKRRYEGVYRLWNLAEMAKILSARIIRNGCVIFADDDCYSSHRGTNFVEIRGHSKVWRAKLVVDFMGARSPLMVPPRVGSLTVITAGTVYARAESAAILAKVRLSAHEGLVERFPMSSDRTYISLIVPATRLKPNSDVAIDLQIAMRDCDSDYTPSGLTQRFRGEIVTPVKRRHHSLDRILMLEEPEDCAIGTGAALLKAIRSSADMACHLVACVKTQRMLANDLCAPPVLPNISPSFSDEKHFDDRVLFGNQLN